MIGIQILLITALILFAFSIILVNPGNLKIQASKKILGIIFVFLAIFFVLFPEKSNQLAHSLGVTRGADLLLYLVVLCFIFVTLSFYLHIKEQQNEIFKLARKIAILESQKETDKSRKNAK